MKTLNHTVIQKSTSEFDMIIYMTAISSITYFLQFILSPFKKNSQQEYHKTIVKCLIQKYFWEYLTSCTEVN